VKYVLDTNIVTRLLKGDERVLGLAVRPVPGSLGDQAVRFPKLGLNVLAGETFIRVVVGPVPDADPKSIAIARAVLKQL